MRDRSPYRIATSPTKRLLLLGGVALVGALEGAAALGFGRAGQAGELGLVMGLVLVTLATVGALLGKKRSVTVDPEASTLTIEDTTRFGSNETAIPFSDIRELTIDAAPDGEAFDVTLRLSTGKRVSLFGNDFLGDRHDRAIMEARRRAVAERVGLA